MKAAEALRKQHPLSQILGFVHNNKNLETEQAAKTGVSAS